MNDDEFFSATDELQTIRQWARARYAAPWAVFGAVLLRVAATTEPNVQLPGVIGGRASLNLLCAFVAPSGGGKGISDKVARLAWPADIEERPLGSGEGLSAIFARPKPKKDDDDPDPGITRAVISVPEVDTLAGLASRQGSILLAQLKSLAMGETIGQSNASAATTRIVPAHSYRACLSVGAQPGHTGVIFDDATGGTPQRFLWFLTVDPHMPADEIPDPAPLDSTLPGWRKDDNGVIEISYGPAEIRQTIIAAHLARQRGEADALDGHAMLTRCKVAATLAVLHHRSVVSELDWQLSAVVMDRSDAVRDWLIDETKKAARKKVQDRAMARVVGEEFIDARRLDTVRRRILAVLRSGPTAGGQLRAALGRREYRELFDRAVSALETEGAIVADSTGRGTRYALESGLNTEHPVQPMKLQVKGAEQGLNTEHLDRLTESTGCTKVQGQSPQVSKGVPPVQGVLSPSTRIASEGPKVDPPSPLHAVPDEPQTATAWLRRHVADLLAAGVDTAESKAVYGAGQAAGFGLDALRQAARKSDEISVIERHGHTAVWKLGEGGENISVTAERWLTDWLSTRGWVKASDACAAGAAAGYGRNTIKSAATRSAVLKRGESVATEWAIDTTTEEGIA